MRRAWLLGIAATCLVGCQSPAPDRLVFFSVGQGDSAAFVSRGTAILIDTGPRNGDYDAGERIVVPRLKRLGVSHVGAIILSHPDLDHIGGTSAVLKAYPEAKLMMSSTFRGHPKLQEVLRSWGRADQVQWLKEGDRIEIGNAKLEVACPPWLDEKKDNDGSLFVLLKVGTATAYFPGDAPGTVEREVELRRGWTAQVMKVSHHGSGSSTPEDVIEQLKPTYAVLSAGRNNTYLHPHGESLVRLAAHNVVIWRTDMQGDCTFEVSEKGFQPVP
jgi:competence protein ComEC